MKPEPALLAALVLITQISHIGSHTPGKRATIILDVPCRLEYNPGREELDAWKGMDIIP